MSSVALRRVASRSLSGLRDHAASLGMFTTAIFLSALLLFSVQPIFAKMVLPKLGGAPSVWAVSMVFFQAVLLGGYAYAHALNRWCPRRQAPLVHLCLMGAAALALPFGLPAFAAEPPAGDAYLWLIGVLFTGVGLPFLAVSANSPLLQSWFAHSGHPQANDPYFLYGASNLGSLIALLAYPVVLEPNFKLSVQATTWTSGFLVLGVLIALCGLIVLPSADAVKQEARAVAVDKAQPVSVADGLSWLWLAAVPSGLLVSFTSYVSTDIASAPFLWVIPLALFLLTFVMVFRDKPLVPHHWMVRSQPLLVAMTLLGMMTPGSIGWMIGVCSGFLAFVVTTLVCHKSLYDLRPAAGQLTAFYMWMSLGGVLGGVFAALIAPQIFNAIYEFPLLLLAGLIPVKGMARAWARRTRRQAALYIAGLGVAFVLFAGAAVASGFVSQGVGGILAQVTIIACGAYLFTVRGMPLHAASVAVVMATAILILPSAINSGYAERSFFGVHRVVTTEAGGLRLLLHGTTLHGAMRIKDAGGQLVSAPLPATYYYPASPMARGLAAARLATTKTDGGLVVGSVGVGSGSMACHAQANEDWTFFDIDPVVVKIATNPKHFNFFSRCRPDAKFVIGDARLTLGKVPRASFDYLIIDAFASDSIPVHLLTREAVELYLSRLTPNGILALHVTNKYMDLSHVAATIARSLGGVRAILVTDEPAAVGFDALPSDVMFLSRSEAAIEVIATWPGATPIRPSSVRNRGDVPWTDDYSNVPGAILRKRSRN